MTDRSVVYKLQADIGQFRAQMAQASASVQDFGKRATAADNQGAKFRAGLTTFGDAAGKAGLVAAAGLGATVKAAMDWETAWAGVTKTVDGSAGQMAALEGELRQLAKTLPASHQEIAAVAEAAGQLGVKRDDVAAFTKTMIDLGETTNLSANDAATAIARFTNVMGTAQGDVGRVGATIVDLGNNFATTEAEITNMAQRLSAAGAIAGLSESDVLGFSAALTSVGVEAEAGGTALSKVFTAVRDASIDGGPKLETFAAVAGTTADEFARMAQADPAKAIDSFIQGLGAMNAQGQSTSSVFKSLGLTDQRLMRAMLSTAEAGDLLSEAVGTSSDAWEENTALTDEAAKRYETAASQVKISWNNIKDAAIDAGASVLPVVEGMATGVATLANAFQSLPGPVKGAVGPLLGLTAIVGGAAWFGAKTISGIANTKVALANLGVQAGTTSKMMAGVGKAGFGLAGLAAAGMAIETLRKSLEESLPGTSELTNQLLELSDGQIASLSGEFDSLSESIARMDPGYAMRSSDAILGLLTFGQVDGKEIDGARQEIEALDAALSNLASSGGTDVATDAFEKLAEAQGLSADEQKELLDLLPGYNDALASNETQSKLAADSTADLADETTALGAAAIETEAQVKAQAKALKEATDSAQNTAGSFFNLGDAVNDTEVSLGGWIKTLHEQADALRNFRVNAEQAADKGLRKGLINALQEAGPEGALRMKQLSNATEEEIGKANRAWQRGMDEMHRYVNFKVPAKKPEVDISGALSAIQIIRNALKNIPDENVVVRVTRSGTGAFTPGFGPQENAEGGFITGPGTGTSDSIPSYLSNGEFVIKAAAVEKYGVHMFDSLNAMHFAGGGQVGRPTASSLSPDFSPYGSRRDRTTEEKIALLTAIKAVRDLQKELAKDGKDRLKGLDRKVAMAQLEAAKQELQSERSQPRRDDRLTNRTGILEAAMDRLASVQETQTETAERDIKSRDEWASRMADVAQGTISGFSSGLFDSNSNPWAAGSGSGPLGNLSADIAGLRQRDSLQTQLAGMGLTGESLAALLSQGSNSDISALITSGQVSQYASLYDQRAALQNSVGVSAGEFAFGAQFDAANEQARISAAELVKTNQKLERMSTTLDSLNGTGPERTGMAVGSAVRGEAIKGHKDKKNRGGRG